MAGEIRLLLGRHGAVKLADGRIASLPAGIHPGRDRGRSAKGGTAATPAAIPASMIATRVQKHDDAACRS